MGHKSYVNPTLDDDDVGGHRAVRRKGSDMPDDPSNERTPLTGSHDRKKDRPLPWTKHQGVRRALLAAAVVVGVLVVAHLSGTLPTNTAIKLPTTPPEPIDVVDGVPDAKEGIAVDRADGDTLPPIVAPFLPPDINPALSLTELLALWKLPEDAVDLMTHREWSEVHEYLAAAAARFEAAHGKVLENDHPRDPNDEPSLPKKDGAASLVVFHRILGEIREKLDSMQAHVAADEAAASDHVATNNGSPDAPDDAPPLTQTSTTAAPITTTTTPEPTTTTPVPTTTTPAPTTMSLPPTTTTPVPTTTSPAPTTTSPPPTTRAPVTLPLAPTSEPAPLPSPPAVSLDYQKGLALWLQADHGVEFAGPCTPESSQCYVKQWKNSVGAAAASSFYPANLANPTTFPVWLPRVRNGLPTLHLTCPMVFSNGVLLRDGMTLFFVISPAHLSDDPNDAKLQKFFGHAPYGQLRFQAKKAGYAGTSAVVAEDNQGIAQGEFAVLTYRLDKHVSIQVNGQGFGSESPVQGGGGGGGIPISGTEATTLGNVKSFCDANAFHGRVGEVLVFDNVLPNDAIDAVHTYLHQKWAIARGVPRSHQPPQAVQKMPDVPVAPTADDSQRGNPTHADSIPHEEPSTAPPPAPRTGGAREPFNRDDVFKWQPPSDADPAQVSQWKEAVADKIRSVERFQFGGKILHDFIDSLKTELNALRDNMFG